MNQTLVVGLSAIGVASVVVVGLAILRLRSPPPLVAVHRPAPAAVQLPVTVQLPLAASTDCGDDARACFDKGRWLYGEEKYLESYVAFQKAYLLRPSYDIAANLGVVEARLNKFCDALEHLGYAKSNLPSSLDANRVKMINARIRNIRKRCPEGSRTQQQRHGGGRRKADRRKTVPRQQPPPQAQGRPLPAPKMPRHDHGF